MDYFSLKITIPAGDCDKCQCIYEDNHGNSKCLEFDEMLEGTDGFGHLMPCDECKKERKPLEIK